MFHARVERRAPAAVVVLRELQIVALAVHPDGDVAEPGQESSQVRRAHSARSYEDIAHPAKPTRCAKELAALVEHATG